MIFSSNNNKKISFLKTCKNPAFNLKSSIDEDRKIKKRYYLMLKQLIYKEIFN
jgi:hypothetical protein